MQHCRESWGLWTIVLEAVRYTTVTLLCVKPQIVLSTCFIYLFFCLVIWIFYILRHYRSPIDIIFCSSVLLLQKRFSCRRKTTCRSPWIHHYTVVRPPPSHPTGGKWVCGQARACGPVPLCVCALLFVCVIPYTCLYTSTGSPQR